MNCGGDGPPARTATDAVTPWNFLNDRNDATWNKAIKARKSKLAFIGDSWTQFWLTPPNNGRGGVVTGGGLNVWNMYYAGTPYNATNCGQAGEKTECTLGRIQYGLLDGCSSLKAVILTQGRNNLSRVYPDEPGWAASGVLSIMDLVQAKLPGVFLIYLSIFPTVDPYSGRTPPVNAITSGFANGIDRFVLDLTAQLAPSGVVNKSVYTIDNGFYVHINGLGYQIWRNELQPLLNQLGI